MTTVSFDCESISLTGETFCVGAVTDAGQTFFAILRDSLYTPVPWVVENVMPAIRARIDLETGRGLNASPLASGDVISRINRTAALQREAVYRDDYRSLCLAFFDWVRSLGAVTLVADWGYPVEARYWSDCLRFAAEREPGSEFGAPCPVHEVATALLVRGREVTAPKVPSLSVGGSEHDPVYDAAVSLARWQHAGGTPSPA